MKSLEEDEELGVGGREKRELRIREGGRIWIAAEGLEGERKKGQEGEGVNGERGVSKKQCDQLRGGGQESGRGGGRRLGR